ncbi:MAG: porin family protein [Variibacter sp.]|nr:porin family protein [Variibacter sp.]
MSNLKTWALAGLAALAIAPAAQAADLPILQRAAPVVAEDFTSGWYLRGDIGIGMNRFRSFDHTATNAAFVWPASWNIDSKGMNDSVFIGAGIGYQWNSWLRFDFTGEYRMTTRFRAVGSYSGVVDFCAGGGKCFDVYDGNHSAAVFLANAYVDLGTWGGFTPFVGAGVGTAYHNISGLWDLGLNSDGTTGRGFANSYSGFQFAWAVHAGVSYNVASNLKLELAYRYLNMGSVRTGIVDCVGCGAGGPLAYYTLRNLDAHDVKLGLRWMLNAPAAPEPIYQAPLMRKG